MIIIPTNGAENCVIDCEGIGGGFRFGTGEGRRSALQGLTSRNGNASAIFCSSSSPTIQNCTIADNSVVGHGAPIWPMAFEIGDGTLDSKLVSPDGRRAIRQSPNSLQ